MKRREGMKSVSFCLKREIKLQRNNTSRVTINLTLTIDQWHLLPMIYCGIGGSLGSLFFGVMAVGGKIAAAGLPCC